MKTTFLLGGDLEINRMGYGAMRIIHPQLFGIPENPQHPINVLRRAVELGVNFIDTADQYGRFASEQLIAEALHPYKENLIIGTKGAWSVLGHGQILITMPARNTWRRRSTAACAGLSWNASTFINYTGLIRKYRRISALSF